MIEFLLNNLGSQQFYYYLDIPSIGALHNVNHNLNKMIKYEVNKDFRVICDCCMCNICDSIVVDSVFEMYAFYKGENILLVCPWYFEILHKKLQ
jgi:hypothetical protein